MTGFTAAGITAASTAAAFMGTYEGYVSAGSACAVLQSVGAAGLGAVGTALSSAAGAVVGFGFGLVAGL